MQYMVIGSDGKEYGPAGIDVLKQWAADKRLLPTTQLRDFQTGQTLYASALTEIFPPAVTPTGPPPAGGEWTQPPAPSNYVRPAAVGNARMAVHDTGTSDFWWAIVRSALALASFFIAHGLGVLFGGYALYYAVRSQQKGHKLGMVAIVISGVTLAAILIGWYFRVQPSPNIQQ